MGIMDSKKEHSEKQRFVDNATGHVQRPTTDDGRNVTSQNPNKIQLTLGIYFYFRLSIINRVIYLILFGEDSVLLNMLRPS